MYKNLFVLIPRSGFARPGVEVYHFEGGKVTCLMSTCDLRKPYSCSSFAHASGAHLAFQSPSRDAQFFYLDLDSLRFTAGPLPVIGANQAVISSEVTYDGVHLVGGDMDLVAINMRDASLVQRWSLLALNARIQLCGLRISLSNRQCAHFLRK